MNAMNAILGNQTRPAGLSVIVWVALILGTAITAHAQIPDITGSQKPDSTSNSSVETVFPVTLDHGKLYLAGQINSIYQSNPPFYAKYTGLNSFQPYYQKAVSRVMTLYTGYQFTSSSEALVDVEEAGGQGIGQALGIAGFTNLEAVRNPTLGQSPYLARVMFHQVIALSDKKREADSSPISTFANCPCGAWSFVPASLGCRTSLTSTGWAATATCSS